MTHDEAKLPLGLFRPDQDDPADPLFSEALAQMESNQDLASWFAREKSLDQEMRSAVKEMMPPSSLRDSLLAKNKIIQPSIFSQSRWMAPALAIAAALILLVVMSALIRPHAPGVDPVIAALTQKIPALTDAHNHAKATSGDFAPLRSWLAEHGGASDFQIPKSLQNVGGVACEVTEVEGRKVTILCFNVETGRHPHLYVVETPGSQPDPAAGPVFTEIDGVAVASWQENGKTYFLAERGSMESVRNLL